MHSGRNSHPARHCQTESGPRGGIFADLFAWSLRPPELPLGGLRNGRIRSDFDAWEMRVVRGIGPALAFNRKAAVGRPVVTHDAEATDTGLLLYLALRHAERPSAVTSAALTAATDTGRATWRARSAGS